MQEVLLLACPRPVECLRRFAANDEARPYHPCRGDQMTLRYTNYRWPASLPFSVNVSKSGNFGAKQSNEVND